VAEIVRLNDDLDLERRKREAFELLLREIEPELNEWDFPITLQYRVRAAHALSRRSLRAHGSAPGGE